MVYSDSDPNWLLFEIVNTSVSTANSLIANGIDEAKNLIDNAVQKMFEFEKSGVVIEADVKFRVLFQKAKQAKLIYCRSSNANRNARIR